MTTFAEPITLGFRHLPVAWLKPSPANPRRHMSDEADQQLADSITAVGILEPLIARPLGAPQDNAGYEVVAGHRRLRAAQLAGVDEVPVIVKHLTDTEALEIALIENDQRKDVHPLDEAEAFASLLKVSAYSAIGLAAKLGRPLRFVQDRLRLLDLTPELAAAFESDHITLGHAQLIAKLTPEQQRTALKACFTPVMNFGDSEDADDEGVEELRLNPVHKLKDYIAEEFPLDLGSPETQAEFPELAAAMTAAEAAGATVLLLSEDWGGWQDAPVPGEPLRRQHWSHCKAGDPHARRGVVVQGRNRGAVIWVQLKADLVQERDRATSTAKPAPSKAEKQFQAEQKRKQQERERQAARRNAILLRGVAALATHRPDTVSAKGLRLFVAAMGNANFYPTPYRDAAAQLGVPVELFEYDFYAEQEEGVDRLGALSTAQLITVASTMAVLAAAAANEDGAAQAFATFGVDLPAIEAAYDAEQAAQAPPAKPAKGGRRKGASL